MNRTIEDAAVKRFHRAGHDQLRLHPADFVDGYDYARRPRTLKGLTSREAICRAWTRKPGSFNRDPLYHVPELDGSDVRRRPRGRAKRLETIRERASRPSRPPGGGRLL